MLYFPVLNSGLVRINFGPNDENEAQKSLNRRNLLASITRKAREATAFKHVGCRGLMLSLHISPPCLHYINWSDSNSFLTFKQREPPVNLGLEDSQS